MALLHLEILTPDREALSAEVSEVNLPGTLGRLGILPNHTALISSLTFGPLTYKQSGVEKKCLCGSGFVEVRDNRVSVLVKSAESDDEIDVDRAKKALERARSRLNSKGPDINVVRAELALQRAQSRLRFLNQL
ncbi:MAG: F0F1 ATP synthase subunit epsilon [Acidobacteria bacterium]|nr:F0F1 ATP synthase subunit epsilon [Acidobacteriota bacterium]MCB9396404.1 F0F1 ATP synthase subunit epsilon [Acidobacteriota bacterium]